MPAYDTILMVVVYPGIENFIYNYFASVKDQTYKKFDILILNDGFEKKNLGCVFNSIMMDMPTGLPPGQIRLEGINYAIENNYQNIIFSDVDDYFSSNRIEESLVFLENHDFVYNNIVPVDMTGEPMRVDVNTNFKLPDQISNYEKLLDYNLFGMSTTGLVLSLLKNFYIPKDIIAVDWWIYTYLLLNGAHGKRIDNATTYYRQSADNLVGMKKPLNDDRLETGINVKQAHYHHVFEYCNKNNLETATKDYALKIEEILELKSALENEEFRKRYIEIINKNMYKIYKGWWSELISLEEWKKYE